MRLYLRGRIWWLDAGVRSERLRVSLETTDRAVAEGRALRLLSEACGTLEHAERFGAEMALRRSAKAHATSMGRLRSALLEIGAHAPELVTRRDVEALLGSMLARGLAPRTVNHARTELRQFFGWLRRRGVVTVNPVEDVDALPLPAPRIRYLDDASIERLRSALVGDMLEPLALTVLYAGLRRSEAVWLDWPDVDLARRILSVRAKGRHWQPKTARNRVVPISAKLAPVLESAPRAALWAFPSPQGKRWHPDNLTSRWRRFTVAASLPDWTLLDLRHTFATHLIRKPEVSFAKLAALMGNSPEICRRHYAHVATEDMHGDVDF